MRVKKYRWPLSAVLAILVFAFVFAACGGDDDSGTTAASTEPATSESGGSDVKAEAEERIAPFVGQFRPPPTLPPLKEPSPGAKVRLMNQGAPETQYFMPYWEGAVKALDWPVDIVNAGTSAESVSSAFDAAVADGLDGMSVQSIPPALFNAQLKELQDQNVAVIESGAVETDQYGIPTVFGAAAVEEAGTLMANYVYVEEGEASDVVFYSVPEIAFSAALAEAFVTELERLCSSCKVRTSDVSAEELGSGAATTVATDLQAHPSTNWAVFALSGIALGLPQQLETAGVEGVKGMTFAGSAFSQEMIKTGDMEVDFAVAFPYLMWQQADAIARLIAGQEVPKEVTDTLSSPAQFITKEDIDYDPKELWNPMENYEEEFKETWGVK